MPVVSVGVAGGGGLVEGDDDGNSHGAGVWMEDQRVYTGAIQFTRKCSQSGL